MRSISALLQACLVLTPALAPATILAQVYPDRPIRMLVGYPAGGSVDASARVLAERMGPLLGQPVLIENRAGATGNIAADALAACRTWESSAANRPQRSIFHRLLAP